MFFTYYIGHMLTHSVASTWIAKQTRHYVGTTRTGFYPSLSKTVQDFSVQKTDTRLSRRKGGLHAAAFHVLLPDELLQTHNSQLPNLGVHEDLQPRTFANGRA